MEVEGLGQVLFCHGSPRSDQEIVTTTTTEGRLREIIAGIDQDLVVCGHTHVQFDRRIDGERVVKELRWRNPPVLLQTGERTARRKGGRIWSTGMSWSKKA